MLAEYWGETAELIYLSPFAGRAIVLILFWKRLSPGLLDSISQKPKNTAQKKKKNPQLRSQPIELR